MRVMSKVVQQLDAVLWIAPTAAEALRMLPLEPDLILMDIGLPDMDGLALTRLIRQVRPEVPIIAVTAHTLPEDRVRCLEAGCTDTISKPFPFQEMVRYLAAWQTTHPSHR
ncbi:MAG: response regulator [Anaerolineae bacterium]|nr:response regulator [Anaerolineae bacterium]